MSDWMAEDLEASADRANAGAVVQERGPGPQFERLQAIAREAETITRPDGTIPSGDYQRLRHQAQEAAASDEDLLDFLENMQP